MAAWYRAKLNDIISHVHLVSEKMSLT